MYINYKQLQDLFSDTDKDENSVIYNEAYNVTTNNAPINLKQARNSADWVQWEHIICRESEQLQNMNTWEIVDKPPDVIPITNKWVM